MGFLDALLEVPTESHCACIMNQAILDPSGTSHCLDSWGNNTDYCTWHYRDDGTGYVWGVMCGGCTASEEPGYFGSSDYMGCPMDINHPSRVTYLDLSDCDLEGSLPWSLLGQLTQLQVLGLRENHLTGTIDGLAALTQLRYFSLFNNPQLSGTIPTALGGLAQLRHVSLFNTEVDAAQCHNFCDAHASTISCYCS
eukprot:SAG31_NODE_6098_length_2171_cov_16.749035_1_plen_196_part_00